MKKIQAIFFILLIGTNSSFAKTLIIENLQGNEQQWRLLSITESLGLQNFKNPMQVVVSVNNQIIRNNQVFPSDQINLRCADRVVVVTRGSSAICNLKSKQLAQISISEGKNYYGSEGIIKILD